MKACLLFLSNLLFLLCSVSVRAQEATAEAVSGRLQGRSFQLETERGYISGILLATDAGDEIRGSMVNEFGVSAIDFRYDKDREKMRLVNVVGFLDKWYIRMVLKKDMTFCLHILYGTKYTAKHGYEVVRTEESVAVLNNKRKLKYTFSPITRLGNSDDTQE